MSRLDEIRARCLMASPGPWREWRDSGTIFQALAPKPVALKVSAKDVNFIIHAREDIPYLLSEVERLTVALAQYREAEEESCEYKIHIPADEGYPDVKGRFYECTCGADYIDIEQAQERQYCPHCGKHISSFETLTCASCNGAEWDEESYYCKSPNGKYHGEEVAHANFDGCQAYLPRVEAEQALKGDIK